MSNMNETLNLKGLNHAKPALFDLGKIVHTANLGRWAEANFPEELLVNQNWLTILINAHVTGCWDELDPDDKKANQRAVDVDNPDRVFSHYSLFGQKVYVITEWDRSVTTLLLPEDY